MNYLKLDETTIVFLEIAANPGLSNDKSKIDSLRHVYCQPTHNGQCIVENGSLFMKEVFTNGAKSIKLHIAPAFLQIIIFIAFHANPISGHLDAYHTYHCIRQHYFWPGIFHYAKRLNKACHGWLSVGSASPGKGQICLLSI